MPLFQIARRFGVDIALWFGAPVAFLIVYVLRFGAPQAAIWPHLSLVALPFALLVLVRLALARVRWQPGLMRAIAAIVTASFLAAMLVYYGLLLMGLTSWGGVIALNVIATVFHQAPEMSRALGVPPIVALIAATLLFGGLVLACVAYLKHFDGTGAVAARMSDFAVALVVIAGVAGVGAQVGRFWAEPWVQVAEPVSLTLFPLADARELEGHRIDPMVARNLDRLEDAARAEYTPAAAPAKRNVILIIVDALRDDHMGVYGYERDTTPNLTRIAETGRARMVRGMRTTCGDTICGLLGISTSKVARRFSFRPFSLQEVLRRNGFRAHMILGGDHTNFYSLKRAYGPVDSFVDGNDAQKQGYFMNDDQFLVDQVSALPQWDGVPALFQFHVMSTHVLRKHEDAPGPWQPSSTYMLDAGRDTGPGMNKVESATNFYDNGVHRTDKVIGDLLKAFESRGYLQNALVVITSDHGESLGEHGLFMHANSLREEALRIPFVLVSYGYEPERALQPRTFASQLDIAPTILAELGIPAPRTWMGHALQEPPVPGIAYLEGRHHVGVIDHRDPQNLWKYWIDLRTGKEHAFNLSQDPKEDHDLIGQIGMARVGEWRLHARSGNPMALASN